MTRERECVCGAGGGIGPASLASMAAVKGEADKSKARIKKRKQMWRLFDDGLLWSECPCSYHHVGNGPRTANVQWVHDMMIDDAISIFFSVRQWGGVADLFQHHFLPTFSPH